MNFFKKILKFFDRAENLVFTNHACICCRREIPDGTRFSLCENCLENIDRIEGKICKICGDKIAENVEICDRCKVSKFDFDKSYSFSVYSDVSAAIIKRFKYSGKKYYAKYIAELMFENKEYFDGIDEITFVPIGKKRKFERGFNQAEEVAKFLGELTGIKVTELLVKCGNERHQAGLSQEDRQKNLTGTICLNDGIKELVKGKNILIIDDVFTTGATLSECARVLKSEKYAKPALVCCYTFAKTCLSLSNNG